MPATETMRAVVCTALGPPEGLEIQSLPVPDAPGPNEVVVALAAWGLNFVDLLMVAGEYQHKPDPPFVPGLEAAGTVVAVGADVQDIVPGARVITAHRPGAMAERVRVPRSSATSIPDGLDLNAAACFRSAFATAYHGLVQGGRVAPGETVLVHGAAGGMGHAAVQVARELGATVIATARGTEKADVLTRLGAKAVIDPTTFRDGRFRDAVKDLTGGRGADVVFDPVGGPLFLESMRCMNWGARLLIVGFTHGAAADAKTNHLLIKGASAIGIRAGEFARRNPGLASDNLRTLMEWADAGRIAPHISDELPLDQAGAGLRLLANRAVIGRAILTRDGPV